MPTIQEVMEIAEALKGASVQPADDLCVAVRNRNASCRRCVEVCIANAITVGANELKVDHGACVGCGACVAVCPTEALIPLNPPEAELAQSIAQASVQAETMAVFACARMAARNLGDPDKYALVPCLGRIDVALLAALASHGFDDIVLVDGTCATCKYGAVDPVIDATVDTACTLLESQDSTAIITRSNEFPPEVLDEAGKAVGRARRGFITDAASQAREAAMVAAQKTIAQKLGATSDDGVKTLRQRLGVKGTGSKPQFTPPRHQSILDDLFAIRERAEESVLETSLTQRLFGTVSIDPKNCVGCGMCVMFCPTGALRYGPTPEEGKAVEEADGTPQAWVSPRLLEKQAEEGEGEEPIDPATLRPVEFMTSDCVQCNLCADACLQKCITVSPTVATDELFSFEPQQLYIRKPQKKPSLFDRH